VGLVIEIEAVADQLIEIDLRRTFRAPVAAGPPIAPVTTSVAAGTPTAITTTLRTSTSITAPVAAATGWTILATAICLFFSHVSLRSYSF
jgi:uncharacterized membrane protein YdfJ with MMPL/SSD domain